MPLQYRWLKALALLLILGLPLVASAQDQGLRREIERRYEVLPVRGGVVLTPRAAHRGVKAVEVSGDAVAVNGERVNAQTLRDWLGEEYAAPVLRLQELDPAERRALFELPAEAERPATPEPEETATPEPADDEVVDEAGTPETPEQPEEAPEETPEETAEGGDPAIQTGSRVNILGNIVVEKDERADEAVAVGGSVRVDGVVSHDVVAIGGPARVNGRVGGSVISVGNSVYLGPGAVVEGDVNSVGGRIERAQGARIQGSISEVSPPWSAPWRNWDFDPDFGPFFFFGTSMEVFGSMVSMMVMALLTCLVLLLARRPLERVDRHLAAEPWKAALVGLAGALSFFPLLLVVTVLLVITIIGCALLLLYPFLFLALGLALLLGYAAAAHRTGRWLEGRFGRSFGGAYAAALIGVFVLHVWSVIGQLLALGPGVLDLFALMFVLFGKIVQVSALVVGFGAVLLARFGAPPRPAPPIGYGPVPPPPAPYGGSELPLTDQRWEEEPPPQR